MCGDGVRIVIVMLVFVGSVVFTHRCKHDVQKIRTNVEKNQRSTVLQEMKGTSSLLCIASCNYNSVVFIQSVSDQATCEVEPPIPSQVLFGIIAQEISKSDWQVVHMDMVSSLSPSV